MTPVSLVDLMTAEEHETLGKMPGTGCSIEQYKEYLRSLYEKYGIPWQWHEEVPFCEASNATLEER